MCEKDLFSVVVLTYNQENLVFECLQSVLEQDYPHIELIVSDDASKDNTLKVVKDWVENNKNRFHRTEIISSSTNQGIPSNYNRGLRATKGEFIKFIGGDDVLLPNALSDVARFFQKKPQSSVCVTLVKPFGDLESFKRVETIPDKKWHNLFNKNSTIQFRALSSHCFIPGPCLFFKRNIFEKCGFFDERIKRFEDWPFLLKLTRQGVKLDFLPEITVKWRIHGDSVSNTAFLKGDIDFFRNQLFVYETYVKPCFYLLSPMEKYHISIQMLYLKKLIAKGGRLKAHFKTRYIKLLDPFWWKNLPTYLQIKLFRTFRLC